MTLSNARTHIETLVSYVKSSPTRYMIGHTSRVRNMCHSQVFINNLLLTCLFTYPESLIWLDMDSFRIVLYFIMENGIFFFFFLNGK